MYDGKGMRIDGVTDGKAAAAAGLKPGDVVIKLGDHDVADMMSYMKALSAFKKGDSTQVTVLREKQEVKADITFK
jgi:S1-C subfamily serine protease